MNVVTRIFNSNFDLGISFYQSYHLNWKDEKNANIKIGEIFAKNDIDWIKSHLDKISEILDREALTPIAHAVAKNDFSYFLENYNKLFKIKNIDELEKEFHDFAPELFSFMINEDETLKHSVPSLPKVTDPKIKINQLKKMFDKINFTDPKKPGHNDPEKITHAGKKVDEKFFKEGLTKLLTNIENKNPVLGPPSDEKQRDEFYENLENLLKHIIIQLNHSGDPSEVATALLDIGESGHCGPGWEDEVVRVYQRLKGEISIPKVTDPKININQLKEKFDNINFTDPKKPGYIDPKKLTHEGKKVDEKFFKEGLTKLLTNIENKNPGLGTPPDEKQRDKFYENLENLLKNIIIQLNNSDKPSEIATALLYIGESGEHCGTRWKGEAVDVYQMLKGEISIESMSLKGMLRTKFDQYKIGVIKQYSHDLIPRVGDVYVPHIRNYIVQTFKWLDWSLNEVMAEMIVDNDPYLNYVEKRIDQVEVIKGLYQFFLPIKLAIYIQGEINLLLQTKPGKIVVIHEGLKNYIEEKLNDPSLKKQITKLESLRSTKMVEYGNSSIQNEKEIAEMVLTVNEHNNNIHEIMRLIPTEQHSILSQASDLCRQLNIAGKNVKEEIGKKLKELNILEKSSDEEKAKLGKDRANKWFQREKSGLITKIIEENKYIRDPKKNPQLTVFGAMALLGLFDFISPISKEIIL